MSCSWCRGEPACRPCPRCGGGHVDTVSKSAAGRIDRALELAELQERRTVHILSDLRAAVDRWPGVSSDLGRLELLAQGAAELVLELEALRAGDP